MFSELPPRARRIQPPTNQTVQPGGTTSACAENTRLLRTVVGVCRNYLRVRGEYARRTGLTIEQWELPPRARRIPPHMLGLEQALGTTSACAENTRKVGCQYISERNYLRVRGEYSSYLASSTCMMELPPRARRIQDHATLLQSDQGTTSACAENTCV